MNLNHRDKQPAVAQENNDEDDEESVHVVLNFKEPPKLAPGTSFRLNLDDETPVLELPDGTKFIGKFEETIGTQMIFEDEHVDNDRIVKLLCHTDKKIVFSASINDDNKNSRQQQ